MTFEPQLSVGNRVVEFLRRGGVWTIGEGRSKAREACIEFLTRIPEDVREFIMRDRGIILIAPPRSSPACMTPFSIGQELSAGRKIRFATIYLDQRLETIPALNSLVVVAKCVAHAVQARAASGATITPDTLLENWGFADDIAMARRRRPVAAGGMSVAGFVN